ncbi:MAG: hypothetical protein JXA74_13105, partial [Anaerolineae bacterium]|nr:hypothetical protein [Anaerolineae bacterium]
ISLAQLPPIVPMTQVLGGLLEAPARALGLPPGTPVVLGGSDVACTLIGAEAAGGDAAENGRACLYLGTAAWISAPGRGRRAFGATATTGAALRWLLGLFAPPGLDCDVPNYEALMAAAEEVPPGSEGLLFLPHLMGERGPTPDPLAKGVLFGLSLAHGRAAITRAVLEGTALHLRSILEALGDPAPEALVTVGGPAKSPLWRGIIADATGVPLWVPRVVEAGALGAAIVAGVGVGLYPDLAAGAARTVRYAVRDEPDASRARFYEALYQVYCELEQQVAPLYGRVSVEVAGGEEGR